MILADQNQMASKIRGMEDAGREKLTLAVRIVNVFIYHTWG